MSPTQTVDYLRKTIVRWEQIQKSLEDGDEFDKLCDNKIKEARERIKQIVRKESPEDFLH
jgi:exonuclease VII small subunit